MEPKESLVKETLESIDGINSAKANPFLFDKVMHRMQGRTEGRVFKPATVRLAIAFVAVLVGLNVFSLLHYTRSTKEQVSSNPVSTEYFSYLNNF